MRDFPGIVPSADGIRRRTSGRRNPGSVRRWKIMLEVKDLSIYFTDRGKREDAVRHVSFSMKAGEFVGIEYKTVAADPRTTDRHDLSGTDDCTESHHEDRTAGRRRVEASLRLFEGRTKTEGVTGSGRGRTSGSGKNIPAVPT